VAKQLFANGASSTLAVSIADTDVTVQVQSGYGVLFPSPTGGDWFLLTLEDNNANVEIVKCTSRSSDLLTVTRAQEGTSAQAFTNTVTRCELRNTKGTLERMLQRSGDTLGGDLELGGYTLSGPGAIGADVDFPLTLAFSVGMIMMWSGAIGSVPTGWALCDGTDGTPDLRGKFIAGAGSVYAIGDTGGAATDAITTAAGGSHTHALTIADHALTTDEIPAHTHTLGSRGSNASQQNNTQQDFIRSYAATDATLKTSVSSSVGGGAAHGHTGSTVDASADHTHTATVDTLPPYYALAYIMFTG
jgi:microcystin-dependent protein